MHARRATNGSMQMKPLRERLGDYRMAKRAIRMEERSESRTMAAMALGRSNYAMAYVTRGFFGRLKWLLFGR